MPSILQLASRMLLIATIAAASRVDSRAQFKGTTLLAQAKDGLRLTIRANGNTHRAGDQLTVAAEFRNISAAPIRIFVERPGEIFYHFVLFRGEGPAATPLN